MRLQTAREWTPVTRQIWTSLFLQPPDPRDAFVTANVSALDHQMSRLHGPSCEPAHEHKFAAEQDGNRATSYELGCGVHDQVLACGRLTPIASIRRWHANAARHSNGERLGFRAHGGLPARRGLPGSTGR